LVLWAKIEGQPKYKGTGRLLLLNWQKKKNSTMKFFKNGNSAKIELHLQMHVKHTLICKLWLNIHPIATCTIEVHI
jgi:hypothetical protein